MSLVSQSIYGLAWRNSLATLVSFSSLRKARRKIGAYYSGLPKKTAWLEKWFLNSLNSSRLSTMFGNSTTGGGGPSILLFCRLNNVFSSLRYAGKPVRKPIGNIRLHFFPLGFVFAGHRVKSDSVLAVVNQQKPMNVRSPATCTKFGTTSDDKKNVGCKKRSRLSQKLHF